MRVEERMLELEIKLIDEFKLTLPPEAYPWNGLSRTNQGALARESTAGRAQAAVRQDVRHFVRRVLRPWRK